jgi:hypothetical protein
MGRKEERKAVKSGFALLVVTAAALAAPASALGAPAIHVTDFSLTAASPDAGASVDASSTTGLSYSDPSEDVKKTIGHFARGMLANPEAVPHCPQSLYLADACPADTRIGTAGGEIDVMPNTRITVAVTGRIYNQELLADEAGRLGIILDTAPTKTFMTAPFYVRSNGDYGLDGLLDQLPRALTDLSLVGGNTQITRLSFTLFGIVNGRKYTRAPTSCDLHVSTGEVYGYNDPTPVADAAPSSYTPTNCSKLPFKPTFSMKVGSKGTTGYRQHPPLEVKVTQGAGEAGISANAVTLPSALTPNLNAFQTLCTSAQLAADACPAATQIGTATATSAFVATPLSGPVYLVQQPGVILPGLVADLRGRVRVKINIATAILGGKLIKSTVTNVPDLPVSTFELKLNGGAKGPLESKADLCFQGTSSSRFRTLKADVTFTGQNGAGTASKPRLAIEGCRPALSASLRRAGRPRPTLRISVTRHPDADKLKSVTLTLPKQLRLSKRAVKRGASAVVSEKLAHASLAVRGKRVLLISGLSSNGASSITLRLNRGVVRLESSTRRKIRHGHKLKLRYKVVAVETDGESFTSSARTRARR